MRGGLGVGWRVRRPERPILKLQELSGSHLHGPEHRSEDGHPQGDSSK